MRQSVPEGGAVEFRCTADGESHDTSHDARTQPANTRTTAYTRAVALCLVLFTSRFDDYKLLRPGFPPANVEWSKLGGMLPAEHQVRDGMLRLTRVSREDAGDYVCTATSRAGRVESTATLVVSGTRHMTTAMTAQPIDLYSLFSNNHIYKNIFIYLISIRFIYLKPNQSELLLLEYVVKPRPL